MGLMYVIQMVGHCCPDINEAICDEIIDIHCWLTQDERVELFGGILDDPDNYEYDDNFKMDENSDFEKLFNETIKRRNDFDLWKPLDKPLCFDDYKKSVKSFRDEENEENSNKNEYASFLKYLRWCRLKQNAPHKKINWFEIDAEWYKIFTMTENDL